MKFEQYSNKYWGTHIKQYMHELRPWLIGGAFFNMGYRFLQDFIFQPSTFEEIVKFHTAYITVAGTLLNPQLIPLYIPFGFILGVMMYNFRYMNIEQPVSAGHGIKVPGLTDEEREKQQMRDYIQYLGSTPHVEQRGLFMIEDVKNFNKGDHTGANHGLDDIRPKSQ